MSCSNKEQDKRRKTRAWTTFVPSSAMMARREVDETANIS